MMGGGGARSAALRVDKSPSAPWPRRINRGRGPGNLKLSETSATAHWRSYRPADRPQTKTRPAKVSIPGNRVPARESKYG